MQSGIVQPHAHTVIAPGSGVFYCLSCGLPLSTQEASNALQQQQQEHVTCEACGKPFVAAQGYYEPSEYAYCAACCRW